MKSVKQLVGRSGRLFTVMAFTAAVLAPSLIPAMKVDAALLTNRKLTMVSTQEGDVTTDAHGTAITAGLAGNGAQTRHTFTFTQTTTAATIGSVALQYCTTPLGDCVMPTGMDVSTVTTINNAAPYGYTAGAAFTFDTTTNATDASGINYFANDDNGCNASVGPAVGRANCILLTDATPQLMTGTPSVTLTFGTSGTDWIKNPINPGVFYVRVLTFSDAAFTTVVDDGAVAGSVNEDIEITAKVQEKLNFSVSNAKGVAPGTTCASLNAGGALTLGTGGILDTASVSAANSYFRLSTNATGGTGTVVQYAGNTLRTVGGTNTIAEAGAAAVAAPAGTERFGMTIDSADTASNGHSFTELAPAGAYTSTTTWAFDDASLTSPITIATTSAAETVTCDTGSVEYVANISTTTKPGTYRTNIMYFAVPTF
jgi:hypothetical protein